MSLCLKRELEATVKQVYHIFIYLYSYILASWLTLRIERMSTEHKLACSPHTNFLVVVALATLFFFGNLFI